MGIYLTDVIVYGGKYILYPKSAGYKEKGRWDNVIIEKYRITPQTSRAALTAEMRGLLIKFILLSRANIKNDQYQRKLWMKLIFERDKGRNVSFEALLVRMVYNVGKEPYKQLDGLYHFNDKDYIVVGQLLLDGKLKFTYTPAEIDEIIRLRQKSTQKQVNKPKINDDDEPFWAKLLNFLGGS